MISIKTHARIGILGNPSDIYSGTVISSTINDFFVKGEINKSDLYDWEVNGNLHDEKFDKLVQSTLVLLKQKNHDVQHFKFDIRTNIPVQAGLAGSTAIIANLLIGLNKVFSFNIDPKTIAHYTRLVEHKVIGNTAGPQDGFVVVFGGIKYMNFSVDSYKLYIIDDINIDYIPFFIGVRSKSISSGDVHKHPYSAYLENDNLREVVKKIENCAIEGKKAIKDRDIKKLGELMNKNQQLTQKYGQFGNPTENVILQRKIDQEILDFCNNHDVIGAKLGGSSGSIIILSEEKPDFLLDFKPSDGLQKQLSKFDANPTEKQISQILKLVPAENRTN